MKKTVKAIICFIMVLALSLSLTACAGKVSEEEARSIVVELVTASMELNEIYYGKGLDYEKSEDGEYASIYSHVSMDSKYKTRDELEEQTKKVFAASYANSIINHAFTLTPGIYGGSSNPRYFEGSDGYLTVMRDYEAREITQYNFDTLVIEKIKRNKIIATITSTENEAVEIIIVKEADGWRVDSATV